MQTNIKNQNSIKHTFNLNENPVLNILGSRRTKK